MKVALIFGVLGVAVGCGSSDATTTTKGDPSTGGVGGFGDGDKDGGDVDPASASGCSDAAKLVYVLSLEGDLHSFAPADQKFTKIGPLNCTRNGKALVPISMAVDRNAIAWVNMRDIDNVTTANGYMFKVDTKSATCTQTKLAGPMGGMGFSTNDANSSDESLFVVGDGLMKVDFAKEKFAKVKDFLEPVDMELTGTGDGRLFGFLISSPLQLAQINKATTAFTDKVKLTTVQTPVAPMFAFSFWGGDFYFYTATSTSESKSTTVSRYRPSDDSIEPEYMKNIGFHIVGAGVSTCAPTTSPK